MNEIFTQKDFAELSQSEKEILEILNNDGELVSNHPFMEYTPSEHSVKHILDYSKALSVRDSKQLNKISMILN